MKYFILAVCTLLGALILSTLVGGTGNLWSFRGDIAGRPLWSLIFFDVRLPRVLVAALVGGALGAAGAALQGLFRNPLADPSVLGISSSAALFAQVTIFTGWAVLWPLALPLAATLGAIVATFVLLRLVRGAQSGTLELLILGGVALGQVAVALSALMMSLALRDFTTAQRLLSWMLGSLDGRTWMHVFWGAGPLALGVSWLIYRARDLDGLTMGDATAHSLGVDVIKIRREVVVASAVLSGVAVAMGGIISFIGLIVPHITRRFLGASHGKLILGSTIMGALVVVLADLVARLAIAPGEIRIGVITGALGAPWFALLLRNHFVEKQV